MTTSWSFSRRLLVVEAVVLALPITLLAGPIVLFSFFRVVSIISAIALISGWRLLVCGIADGNEALRRLHRIWWTAAFGGVLLVLSAFVSSHLPPSFPYSPIDEFRQDLKFCVLGTPLVLILIHLSWIAKGKPDQNFS